MIKFYILTGKTHSGKTSYLSNWIIDKNADGILSPDIKGVRHLLHISSGETRQLETKSKVSNANTISVGKYLFDENAFEWARNILINSINNKIEWLIIDEVGPLELKGNGLEPAIKKIIDVLIKQNKIKIIFVVRESLLDVFINHYKLDYNGIEFWKLINEES